MEFKRKLSIRLVDNKENTQEKSMFLIVKLNTLYRGDDGR